MKPLVKKSELRQMLRDGKMLAELFELVPGQECEIFKADRFWPGDDIIYIPDIGLNDLVAFGSARNGDEIDDIIDCCYTGDDFIEECGGDREMAERLFWYCDWQHPSSALPEIDDDDEKPAVESLEIPLPDEIVKLCECVYDIALAAQYMIDRHEIEVPDSRELFSSVLAWAREFERMNPDASDDHMELVDDFAEEKLTDTYGDGRV